MKKNINIPINTDLNKIINNLNEPDDITYLNEETLMFDQSIYTKLPYPLNALAETVDRPQKRDMALLTILTVLGSILKKYTVMNRDNIEGCQLCTYILGNPSSGKGFATKCRGVGLDYHNLQVEIYKNKLKQFKAEMRKFQNEGEDSSEPEKPQRNYLFLSSNTTKAALTEELFENGGYGLLFAPEADTLVTASKGEHGNFNDILRHTFHGEPYSVNRKGFENGPIEIPSIRFGILLTSTLDQCFKFLQNYESGSFSRFIYYLLPADNKYERESSSINSEKLNQLIKEISEYFSSVGNNEMTSNTETRFVFTQSQIDRRDDFLIEVDEKFRDFKLEGLQSNVKRYCLIFTRICMLISYLREINEIGFNLNNKIECSEVDFKITLAIVHKLINHLQILDYFYETKNPKQRGVAYFTKETSNMKDEENDYANKKKSAFELKDTGLSYSEIALKLNVNKSTICKWFKKGMDSLPFPATATPNHFIINVEDALKKAEVSLFENAKINEPYAFEYNLHELITNTVFKDVVDAIRGIHNKAERNKAKLEKLPAFTVSGSFNYPRQKSNLITHSGFICIDIDEGGNDGIENYSLLKNEFAKILNVAFCGDSVSGNGYYLLIPIPICTFQEHENYFESLKKAFEILGITIDKTCKDVSRLRYMSYDNSPYFPKTVIQFNQLLPASVSKLEYFQPALPNDLKEYKKLIHVILNNEVDITKGYDNWLAICYAIANTFGEGGRADFHSISRYHSEHDKIETDDQYTACLKGKKDGKRYTLKKLFEIAKEQGLEWQSVEIS